MSKHNHEEGLEFKPKFNAEGLLTAITTNEHGVILMVAFMNEEALAKTLSSGEVHYYSRSRQELWHKGATSGQIQRVLEIRVDCDQDALLIKAKVDGDGGACHTGRQSCFYRVLEGGKLAFR